MTAPISRSEAVQKLINRSRLAGSEQENLSNELFRRIREGKVIPIISNTFRLEHIFHGLLNTGEANWKAVDGQFLNVENVLSQLWAQEIGYPLAYNCELAHVAQYHQLKMDNDKQARLTYIDFLKNKLQSLADNEATTTEPPAGQPDGTGKPSFTDLARSLKYPQFVGSKKDPLRILADLPLPIYVTTSFHEFMEEALIQAGKQPVTQVCLWSGNTPQLDQRHKIEKDYIPTVNQPLVYHLYGLESYPTSLVISEDDYLNYLARITHDLDPEHPILPMYLRSALSTSSLLMIGYRLWEWDFRVLFRGVLNAPSRTNWLNLIIQLTPEQQYQIQDPEEARRYLETYFGPAHFKVEWNSTDLFLSSLWEKWNVWRIGQ